MTTYKAIEAERVKKKIVQLFNRDNSKDLTANKIAEAINERVIAVESAIEDLTKTGAIVRWGTGSRGKPTFKILRSDFAWLNAIVGL